VKLSADDSTCQVWHSVVFSVSDVLFFASVMILKILLLRRCVTII